jgi:hypothetical protein
MHDTPISDDPSVATVIDEFLRATDSAERRELRSALSHVAADIGTMPLERVRARHLMAVLDDARAAGLSGRREKAIIDALSALYSFAQARGIVTTNPLAFPAPPPTPAPPRVQPASAGAQTPTLAMVALGARVAFWTAWLITIGFVILLVALVVELA